MAYDILISETQTQRLARKLRNKIGDRSLSAFATDNPLVQALRDSMGELVLQADLTLTLADAEDLVDPLATEEELTDTEERIWIVLTALSLLSERYPEAAANAAIIRSPAGQINTSLIPDAMVAMLDRLDNELTGLLNGDGGGILFIDVSLMDAGRFVIG